jgi:hypothetical protein
LGAVHLRTFAVDPVSRLPFEFRQNSSRQKTTGASERLDSAPVVRPTGAVSPSRIWSFPCPDSCSAVVADCTSRR